MATASDVSGLVKIGDPVEFTVLELAQAVIEQTRLHSKLVREPLPADDPTQRKPDITLARELLGWEPAVPLRVGLERTITYFRRLGNRLPGVAREIASPLT